MSIKKNFFAPSSKGLGAMRRAAMLLLVMMLTMAQTAWAANEETVTWTMDGGNSGQITLSGDYTLINNNGKEIHYSTTGGGIISNNVNLQTTNFRQLNGGFIEFTNLKGVVTKVEMSHFSFKQGGMQMYVGLDKNDTSTLLHIQGSNNDYDFPSSDDSNNQSVTFEGSVTASQNAHLKIMFSGSSSSESLSFKQGSIVVTYIPEDKVDHGHNFTSIVANGNVLTATCTNNETGHVSTCGLQNRQATLTLIAEDVPYDMLKHNAELQPSLGTFQDETGLTLTSSGIRYTNKGNNNVSPNGPYEIGSYTANVTITIGGTGYTLTKDFDILAGFKVNNNYSQFSVSKISALEGDEMTITFTPQMGEALDALTLTGATSGNNIAYTQSGNTYTFNMPAEDVNLNATITYPLNENDFAQSGDTYTIKTAEGWNYFCQLLKVDTELNGFSGKTIELAGDITVTTMAGNYDHSFKGTFDGKGHTLTFNYTADMPNCAPFCTTNGATIRNLHATGLIEGGNWNYMGGLVGSANGKLTIENCHVSTRISSTINGEAGHGGIVGYVQNTNYLEDCNITGCVFDGLIYNPDYAGTTYGCGGFIGAMAQYGYAILKDCLFLHGKYDNNGGKCELKWGNNNDQNSTFFHRSNGYGEGKLTNCFYVGTRGLKQGSPAVESATAPTNFAHFGTPTDHGFLKVYGHTMVFDGKYYTPTYGDLVETYDYSGVKSYIIEYDDAPLGIPAITSPLWTESLRYNRSFTKDKPVTIMLPFNFKRDRITLAGSSENPSGKFYDFKGIDNSGDPIMDEGNEVVENTLQANHPYLYVPAEDTEHWAMYVSDGINIFTQDNGGGTKEAAYDALKLVGTYLGKVWEKNDSEIGKAHVYNDNGELVPVVVGTKIRPTECYFILGTNMINDVDITIPSKEYSGSAQTPEITVKAGETTLTLDTDYTVTAPSEACVNAGDYIFTIKGIGNYSGETTATFTITKATVGLSWNTETFDYDGTEKTITATATGLKGNDECTVTLTDNTAIAVGKYTATATGLGNSNYKLPDADLTWDFEIVRKMENLFGDGCSWAGYVAQENLELPTGVEAYAITALGDATATATELGYIPEDVPVLLKRTDKTQNLYRASAGTGSAPATNLLQKASDSNQPTAFRDYVLYKDQFILIDGGTLADGKVFLSIPANNKSRAATRSIAIEGEETTGIDAIDNEQWTIDNWYSLDGRKLGDKPTKKGIYIHNGRKVVKR